MKSLALRTIVAVMAVTGVMLAVAFVYMPGRSP